MTRTGWWPIPVTWRRAPVEEFAENGFDAAGSGGRFLKIGVGILKRDDDKYDRFTPIPS